MADWPAAVDVAIWLDRPGLEPDDHVLKEVTAAAVSLLTTRCTVFAPELDINDVWVSDAIPDPLRTGAIMLAARWYGRRTRPEGVEGFGGDGGSTVIRYDIIDRDVETMVSPWLWYPIGSA